MVMAPAANQPISPTKPENFFTNIVNDDSKKKHFQEPGNGELACTAETRQTRSYETNLREDLKETVGNISLAGLLTELACSKATRFIMETVTEMERGGNTEKEKQQLPNQLGSNLEFWIFYASI